MLFERAELTVKDGLENEFAEAVRTRAFPILKTAPGVKDVMIGQGVENPNKFVILIGWHSIEAHVAFSKSDAFPSFTEIFKPFSNGAAMEHFQFDLML